jgi:hypothetical protein
MALGGYKFVGYHVSTPDGYDSSDDAQNKAQLLKMFRCRLKAFFDSMALSGAQWEPSLTAGDYSFGNKGNIIYDLGDTNFGAFFKYHGEEYYLAFVSHNVASNSYDHFYYTTDSNVSYYDSGCDCARVGIHPFTPQNCITSRNGCLDLNGIYGSYSNTSFSLNRKGTSLYYGCATKGCDIIEFSGSSLNRTSIYFQVMSPNGFSTLCSSTDTFSSFSIRSNGFSGTVSNNETELLSLFQVLRNNGSVYRRVAETFPDRLAWYRAVSETIPYASPIISNIGYIADINNCINSDGIRSKGLIKTDLMSVNTIMDQSESYAVSPYNVYAGGNYLCLCIYSASSSSYYKYQGAVYCGWDPSNPSNILASTSYTEYTE